jgi:acyl dehydratase
MSARAHGDWRAGETLAPLELGVGATTIVAGALATRDYAPLHHDTGYARAAGHADILLNAPVQQALFARYLAERCGRSARLARLRIALQAPVYAGARVRIVGQVAEAPVDARGHGWLEVDMTLHADDVPATRARARLAMPRAADDDPWARTGPEWQP